MKSTHNRRASFSTAAIFVAALLLLAIFQSNALLSLTYDLPQNTFSEKTVAIAEQWHGRMQSLGTAQITETIAELTETAHDHSINQ